MIHAAILAAALALGQCPGGSCSRAPARPFVGPPAPQYYFPPPAIRRQAPGLILIYTPPPPTPPLDPRRWYYTPPAPCPSGTCPRR